MSSLNATSVNLFSDDILPDGSIKIVLDPYDTYPEFEVSYLVSEYGDTLFVQDGKQQIFIVPPGLFGTFVWVTDLFANSVVVDQGDLSLCLSSDFVTVPVPCDRSISMKAEEVVIDILGNDKICRNTRSDSVSSKHVTIEIISPEYVSRTRIDNGKIYFTPDYDGKDSETFSYAISLSGVYLTDSAEVAVFYKEKDRMKVFASVEDTVATVLVSNGVVPYLFLWNDSIFTYDSLFPDLIKGENTVLVTDSWGCVASDTLEYNHLEEFVFPEFITPNGDGVSDTWELPNLLNYTKYQVSIYDRRGMLLYHSVNNYEPWGGTYLGKNMPSADYWFLITLHDVDKEIAGHFTLMR